jgi:hypothetical protein
MAQAGLAFLARADMSQVPLAALAECLRRLERAESMHAAARARVLSAFAGQRGFEDDGQGSPGAWLRWQARITQGAAAGAVAWVRRLAAHPAIGEAMAAGEISASWAREICGWTGRLPADKRADADAVLLAAAAGGADLADLAALAEEMFRRCAPPDCDDDDGFADRWLRLDLTFHGAGRAEGDLTPQCAAALRAVLEALGSKAGPEDVRTKRQRDHDALEEACRRLIGAGCLPERAGQPTQVQLHMTLDQLRGMPGGQDAQSAWVAAAGSAGWAASPAAASAYACDAKIIPVVCGHLDPAALADMTAHFLGGFRSPDCACGSCACGGCACGGCACPPGPVKAGALSRETGAPGQLPAATMARLQDTLLRYAASVLSGPAGLAAFLRTGLTGRDFPAVSLPLDTGAPTEGIPAHLRRAVIARDGCCAFPGCIQPPAACQVHHILPRSAGGLTRLGNLLLLCSFHHLIAIHRWGWTISLHGKGPVTAVSPDRTRTLHSHDPCRQHPHSHGPPAAAA